MDRESIFNDKLILAEGIIRDADPSKTGLNGNVIVIGGTGSGKTVSYTEANLLHTFDRSLVVSVSKRSLISKYSPLFQKKGYQVEVIDLISPEKSTVGYDPMRYINNNEDIMHLAKAIVSGNAPAGEDGNQSYWDNTSVQLCAAEIAMAKELLPVYEEMGKDVDQTFNSVLKIDEELYFKESMGMGFTKSSLDHEFEALKEYDPDSFAFRNFSSISGLASRTVSCITSTLKSSYGDTFSSAALSLMSREKTFEFKDLADRKTVLFIVTNPVNKSSHAFANLMFAQMFKNLYEYYLESGSFKKQVHVICDDFAVSAKIYDFEKYISIFRESGISVSVLVQSLSQLASLYGEYASSTIMNNCDRILYLGGMDLFTCQNMAQRLDVPLSDVLNAKLESAFVMQRGERPIIGSRYKTYEDFAYEEVIINQTPEKTR